MKKFIFFFILLIAIGSGILLYNLNRFVKPIVLEGLSQSAQTTVTAEEFSLNIFKGSLYITNLAFQETDTSLASGSIGNIDLQILLRDLLVKKISISSLLINEANLKVFPNRTSQSLATDDGESSNKTTSQKKAIGGTIAVGEASINKSSITIIPEGGIASSTVDINTFTLKDFLYKSHIDFGGKIVIDIKIDGGQKGIIAISGDFRQDGGKNTGLLDMDIKSIDIPLLQKYILKNDDLPIKNGYLDIGLHHDILNGQITSKGFITFNQVLISGQNQDIANAFFAQNFGKVTLDLEAKGNQDRLEGTIATGSIAFRPYGPQYPDQVQIENILFSASYESKTKSVSLESILIKNPFIEISRVTHDASTSTNTPVTTNLEKSETQDEASPIAIDKIVLENGALSYYDPLISKRAGIHLTDIFLTIQNAELSSALNKCAFILQARLDKQYGTIQMGGDIHVEPDNINFDVESRIEQVPIPYLYPFYEGKFDFEISNGTIHLVSQAKCNQNNLKSSHSVMIDHLEIAPTNDEGNMLGLYGPQIMEFLRGKDGRITFNFDLNGDIKKPKFSFGASFQKALVSNIGQTLISGTKSIFLDNELVTKGQTIGKDTVQSLANQFLGGSTTASGENTASTKETLKQASEELKSLFGNIFNE